MIKKIKDYWLWRFKGVCPRCMHKSIIPTGYPDFDGQKYHCMDCWYPDELDKRFLSEKEKEELGVA